MAEDIVRELIDKSAIHPKILKNVKALEQALRTGSPDAAKLFYIRAQKELNTTALDQLRETTLQVANKADSLNADDNALIGFFADKSCDYSDFMQTSGTLISAGELMEELLTENLENPSKPHTVISSCLWTYLTCYELVLELMTQRLRHLPKNEQGADLLKLPREEHLTAGAINKQLINLKILQEKNNSILGEGREYGVNPFSGACR